MAAILTISQPPGANSGTVSSDVSERSNGYRSASISFAQGRISMGLRRVLCGVAAIFHFGDLAGNLLNGNFLFAIQVSFAHRQPRGHVADFAALYKTHLKDIIEYPFGGGHTAL